MMEDPSLCLSTMQRLQALMRGYVFMHVVLIHSDLVKVV